MAVIMGVVAAAAPTPASAQTTEARTVRVSVTTRGSRGGGASLGPQISANGRYVAFLSYAGNLVAGDTNRASDVFVRLR